MSFALKVKIATHHFVVYPSSQQAKDITWKFLRRYIHEDIQGTDVKLTVFSARRSDGSEFRFHINSLSDFKRILYENYLLDKTEFETRPVYVPTKRELVIKDKWSPRGDQPRFIEYFNNPVGEKDPITGLYKPNEGPRARFLGLQTGEGKAQPMDALFKTPTGWLINKDAKVGDVLLMPDGSTSPIVAVHPQGVKDALVVKFGDGRLRTFCKEHLWSVYVNQSIEAITVTTDAMRTLINSGNGVRIDLHQSADYTERESFRESLIEEAGSVSSNAQYFVSRATEEEARALQQKAWSMGFTARYLGTKKPMVVIVTNEGTFHTTTLSVERVDVAPACEMQCIEIAHAAHLYITDDWIVTHNTATSLMAIAARNEMLFVVVLARFVNKWVDDIADILKVSKSEIIGVKGGEAVQGLTQLALQPKLMKNIKAIVVSNSSFDTYLRLYELYGAEEIKNLGYMVPPDELMERLDVGTRLIDEVHMEFHSHFRLDLYTHCPRSISLTATLKNNDPKIERFYELAYPRAERCPEPEFKRYTRGWSVYYNFPTYWSFKTSARGRTTYSHNAYEDSIMKNTPMKIAYYKMVKRYLDMGWKGTTYQKGDKFLVFCSTIAMCTDMSKWLGKQYPDMGIYRYVGADNKEFEKAYRLSDGTVTTPGAGGTGHDAKGITDVHNTVAMDSFQQNVQIFGRARKIEGRDTRYYWYTNTEIPQHIKYDKRRFQILQPRALSLGRMSAGTIAAVNN